MICQGSATVFGHPFEQILVRSNATIYAARRSAVVAQELARRSHRTASVDVAFYHVNDASLELCSGYCIIVAIYIVGDRKNQPALEPARSRG
jgi:hypothetical protein